MLVARATAAAAIGQPKFTQIYTTVSSLPSEFKLGCLQTAHSGMIRTSRSAAVG